MRHRGLLLAALAVALLASASPLAADAVIQRGIDAFTTTADGNTYYDFAHSPIPAGFFCKKSPAFTGRMTFKGVPLATGTPGQLRNADTVIERLDDAVFNAKGTAVTRIRFRALSLVSIAPIKTACGAFHVYVSLADQQRVTIMHIDRTREDGGNFVAPLAVDVRMTFIPVKPARSQGARKLELKGSFTFPAAPIPWSFAGGPRTKRIGSVLVDTNGDLTPDTLLSGTANFFPGWSPEVFAPKACYLCEPQSCHIDPSTGKQHCTGPYYACNGSYCP